jgi:hypothetical protein
MDITYTEEDHDRDTFSAVTGHAFDINDADIELYTAAMAMCAPAEENPFVIGSPYSGPGKGIYVKDKSNRMVILKLLDAVDAIRTYNRTMEYFTRKY